MSEVKEIEFPAITWDEVKERPLSFSSLKEMRKSPRHFIYYRQKAWTPPTPAMALGKLAEHLLIEQETPWQDKFYEMPKIRRLGAANLAEIDRHYEAAKGKTIIEVGTIKIAQDIVEVGLSNPEVRELVENKTKTQRKLLWKEHIEYEDRDYFVPMTGFSDWEVGNDLVLELKTAKDASYDGFSKAIHNSMFLYYLQLGAYSLAYQKMFYRFPKFKWVVLETTEPYGSNIIEISQKDLDIAKAEIRGLCWGFVRAIEENSWNEDYRFWLLGREAYTYFMPKWVQNPHLNLLDAIENE